MIAESKSRVWSWELERSNDCATTLPSSLDCVHEHQKEDAERLRTSIDP